jgi:ABC-2 type transport system ATP-binding protein
LSALELDSLSKSFGERVAVSDLSFSVEEGEVFGLLGPNGAGKTTTVRMLTGLISPTSGSARVMGDCVVHHGERVRAKVGLLTEQPGLYDRLSARDNLRFFIKLHGLQEGEALRAASAYLARFGLLGREREPAGGFSKGMRQKLAIIRTLLHRPKVVFLDEPTSGLDPESARTVRDALAELAREGRTLVICSHNLAEVERLCSRVVVIKQRALKVSSVSELREEGLTLEVKLGSSADAAVALVQALPFAPTARGDGDTLRVHLRTEEEAPDVVAALTRAGLRVYAVVPGARPLEEVYLELMRKAS